MTRRYALRDDQWERIKDLLPGRPGTIGVTAKDNRLLLKPSCIAIVQAFLGATCQSALETFVLSIRALAAGRNLACGSGSLSI
jgi:hypothetical protein